MAVLGAGVMGAQIAAHFANAGVPALLLDVTADAAKQGLERARKLKPDPFFTPDTWKLITTGGFDEALAQIKESDWIVEAIIERLDAKQALLERVDAARRKGHRQLESSGIHLPRGRRAQRRFRRHWMGTHFFNRRATAPAEIVPTAEPQQSVIDTSPGSPTTGRQRASSGHGFADSAATPSALRRTRCRQVLRRYSIESRRHHRAGDRSPAARPVGHSIWPARLLVT